MCESHTQEETDCQHRIGIRRERATVESCELHSFVAVAVAVRGTDVIRVTALSPRDGAILCVVRLSLARDTRNHQLIVATGGENSNESRERQSEER